MPIGLPGIGGIDPDFFFDDDGKAYVTSCADPPQALYNGHRAITLQEMDFEQQKPIGEKTIIIDGGTDISKHPIWCEGPHLYKVNGKYYAMCAQGGTSTAHTEVIFKADSVRGPYVPWDKNPILTQMGLPAERPNPVTCSGRLTEVSLEQPAAGRGGRGRGAAIPPTVSAAQKLPDNTTSIDLKIEGAGPLTRCFYKTGAGAFTQLGQDLPSSFLSTDTAGGFQGVTLGMFAHN